MFYLFLKNPGVMTSFYFTGVFSSVVAEDSSAIFFLAKVSVLANGRVEVPGSFTFVGFLSTLSLLNFFINVWAGCCGDRNFEL